jgi:hypothetical protein
MYFTRLLKNRTHAAPKNERKIEPPSQVDSRREKTACPEAREKIQMHGKRVCWRGQLAGTIQESSAPVRVPFGIWRRLQDAAKVICHCSVGRGLRT